MPYLATRARHDPSGYQLVEVLVDRGYEPDVIEAAAGMPIRLVFSRRDDDPCSERVVFSSPRVDRRLAQTGTTTVDLPGQEPGEVRFTCGMGRYRGRIQIIDGHKLSTGGSVRHMLARIRPSSGAPDQPAGGSSHVTAHVGDQSHSDALIQAPRRRQLPRWLMPGVLITIVAVWLVLTGIVPVSTMFYAGMFGAMLLMHRGGHGSHDGHRQHGEHTDEGSIDTPPDRYGQEPRD